MTVYRTSGVLTGTIERNGGVYEDTRNGKRRYWIPTS